MSKSNGGHRQKSILLIVLFFATIISDGYSMSASHGCSQKAYEQRKTGYKFLSGITSLSAFAATSFAIGDAQKNREGKKLLDDTKVFLMAVTGATVGILSFLTVSPDCVVKEKNKNIHF